MTSRTPSVALSASERALLVELAEAVGRADCGLSEARERQNKEWRRLIMAGRTKTAIAEASGITKAAVNFRLGISR